jgi:hypothetical protein
MWSPDKSPSEGKDLLATTGDYLRIWNVRQDVTAGNDQGVEMESLLNNVSVASCWTHNDDRCLFRIRTMNTALLSLHSTGTSMIRVSLELRVLIQLAPSGILRWESSRFVSELNQHFFADQTGENSIDCSRQRSLWHCFCERRTRLCVCWRWWIASHVRFEVCSIMPLGLEWCLISHSCKGGWNILPLYMRARTWVLYYG